MQDYKSISLAIFTDYDRVLKDLFATLYLDIHASIKTNLNVVDEGYIDDLKGYPEEHDLNNTIQRFFWAHYQCDLISSAKKNHHFKFPVSDVLQILTRKPFNKQKKLVIKIQKKFEQKHKLTSIDQFSYCAREIRRWRNLASHNNGLDSIAKASVLWSNINIFIKTYPDDLREKIRDLESLEKVVNEDFRNAVLENATVYQSIDAEKDIEKQIINYFKKHASTDNESDDTSQILEKLNLIELDTNKLLNEIVAS